MAYVSQDKKAKIAANLKKVMPDGWKYSLAVRNHSTIVLTISAAPVNLIAEFNASQYFDPSKATHADVNAYHIDTTFRTKKMAEIFKKIVRALNTDNHDNSDIMTDYFDVGHYVDIQIGRWNKPFVVKK